MDVISHRGLCEEAVENTLPAFRKARESGFSFMETDLRVTVDGHIVAWHDTDFQRIGNSKRAIHAMTLKEVRAVALPFGSQVATLDEIFQEFPEVCFTFDIKPETGDPVIDALVAWARRRTAAAEDWLIGRARFLFWRRSQEKRFQSLFPSAKFYARKWECICAGLCVVSGLSWLLNIDTNKIYSVPPKFLGLSLMNRSIVYRYHSLGVLVLAYLPTGVFLECALEAGFDQILIDVSSPEIIGHPH